MSYELILETYRLTTVVSWAMDSGHCWRGKINLQLPLSCRFSVIFLNSSATVLTVHPHQDGNYTSLCFLIFSPVTLMLLNQVNPVSYQHYLWASGHFLSSLRYHLTWASTLKVSLWWYKGLLLLEYGISSATLHSPILS